MKYLKLSFIILLMFMIYHFRNTNWLNCADSDPWIGIQLNQCWLFDKFLRFILNSLLSVYFILFLFNQPTYTRFAAWVFCFSFLLLMPMYLISEFLQWSSMISSALHRLITTPFILLFLIAAFYFQIKKEKIE